MKSYGYGYGLIFGNLKSAQVLVGVPSGFLTTPPFPIYKNWNNYYPDPAFNLEAHANISVAKTYYVDGRVTGGIGSDSNNGLTLATPFKTLSKIQSQGDADLVYVFANSYFQKNERPTQFTRSIKFIGLGSGSTRPKITADVNNQTGSFSVHSGSCYVATIAEYVGYAYDKGVLTSYGNPTGLIAAASIAACVSTAGTFFTDWPSRKVYVRLPDSRVPDSNLILGDALCMAVTADNRKQYFENIIFDYIQLYNSTSTGGLKMYFKGCQFQTCTAFGVTECMFQNCVGIRLTAGDVFNYDLRNTIGTTAYEINCEFTNQKLGASNDQASTTHNGCTIIRIGGKYHDTAGQSVADVTGGVGQTWMLGCELYESVSGVAAYFDLSKVWLDGVYIHDINIGLQIQGTCQGYYRNLRNLATTPTDVAGTASFNPY